MLVYVIKRENCVHKIGLSMLILSVISTFTQSALNPQWIKVVNSDMYALHKSCIRYNRRCACRQRERARGKSQWIGCLGYSPQSESLPSCPAFDILSALFHHMLLLHVMCGHTWDTCCFCYWILWCHRTLTHTLNISRVVKQKQSTTICVFLTRTGFKILISLF